MSFDSVVRARSDSETEARAPLLLSGPSPVRSLPPE